MALFPFSENDELIGLLLIRSSRPDFLSPIDIRFYEGVAKLLGVAVTHSHTRLALRERLKELTCLLEIGNISSDPDLELDSILQQIVELLPPAWLYPEVTSGRIALDERSFETCDFQDGPHRLSSDLVVDGRMRGYVEVVYSIQRPPLDEGPFLKEERTLIDAIAREVGLIVGRKRAAEERKVLQVQLMHADRLATIGQLAAGVAHEINEPLGHILGFAQLIQKEKDLTDQAQSDLDRIVRICLHARQVIQRLMLFSRQVSPSRSHVDLGVIAEEAVGLFSTQCEKVGIELQRELIPDLKIFADPAQLNQVLVNLIVNAMHAMPNGGVLTLRTAREAEQALIMVADNGIGMSEEVSVKAFEPFFTTKDVDQGTGLGLSVVHGIVQSHGGSVQVESQAGRGSRFTIRLPIGVETKEAK
jgi:signal transduction histidine kinase